MRRPFSRLLQRLGIVLVTWSTAWLLGGLGRASDSDTFRPFELALLGDPQIGYGRGGEYQDASRFRKVIDDINRRRLPLSIIPGDLVQDRSLWQDWTFDALLERLQGKVLLAPGNHDVVDLDSLARFRSRYGKDYFDVVFHNCAFIFLNSETARDASLSEAEFAAQWAYLESTLAAHHRARRQHIVLVMHRPPFVDDEDEPESPTNFPKATRKRLLTLARTHGVRFIFAGHLHRTVRTQTRDGIHIFVSAGTSRSFDQSPVAYYRVAVQTDALRPELQVVDKAPAEPFSVPGLRDWTPRLFEFSIRHWLFTAMYVLTATFALRASQTPQHAQGGRAERELWLVIACTLFFLGANMQLDVDELVRELGRVLAKVTGVFAVRHVITASFASLVAVSAGVFLRRFYRSSTQDKSVAVALIMLTLPTAWFCLSVISHHDLGMIFPEMVWDLLIVIALVVIGLSARRNTRSHAASQ